VEDHKDHALEEFLEALYKTGEDGTTQINPLKIQLAASPTKPELSGYATRGFINIKGDFVELTEIGTARAELLVRRHRLAERLFSEVLNLNSDSLDSTSCTFEHVVDPAVIESICTMLGHPPTCPHGKRIPPGECCKASRREIAPVVVPLKELSVGSNAKIVFITTPHHQRLNRLVNLGVVPGGKILLHQKRPSYLLKLGQTDIAIDEEIASEIYVRKI